jgi:hypothetical protein
LSQWTEDDEQMVSRLLVIPCTGEPTLRALLDEQGIVVPDRVGCQATVEMVESILAREGWQYHSRLVTGAWEARFVKLGGRLPPISELSLGPDGTLDFGASPLYGPWHVSREVARECGPQVAVISNGDATCLVTEQTGYDEWHECLTGRPVPADRSDREWIPVQEQTAPVSVTVQRPLPTPEDALEEALAGGRGHGQAAMQVGRALQAFRWGGPPKTSLFLDEERYHAIVQRLRCYVRDTPVPSPHLVWALGQAGGARDDLIALVDRLEACNGAAETLAMARVFLR